MLSKPTQKFIANYESWYQLLQPKEGVARIHVDEVASKVEKFYEKIREVVDWREKHLMRRIALERILKRRLFLKINSNIAEPLVLELIRGGHFPNDAIPVQKIEEAQRLLNKYTYILAKSPPPPKDKIRSQLYTYILGIAACEVEETLDPASYLRAQILIEYMEEVMQQRIRIGRRAKARLGELSEAEKKTQIYIAVQQSLLKLDSPIITYNLFKRWFLDWSNLSSERLAEITNNIYLIWEKIEKDFKHPLADKFYNVCEQYDAPFLLLGDAVAADLVGVREKMLESATLETLIKKVYIKRFKTLKSRLARAATYSTLSIFLTNVFSLYILEFPFAKYVMGSINPVAAVFDVLGPTFLMLLLVVTIRPPRRGNFKLVFAEVEKNVYETDKKDTYEIELYPQRSFLSRILVTLLYVISFVIVFGVIIWILYKFGYPPLSYLLLIIFTSLIAFAGTQIRQRSRELHITPEKEGLFHIIIDPLSIPVIRLGRWLAERWKKVNIVTVFFNLLIDAPFLTFVEFLEQWRYFLKEKKEEIR